MKIVERLVNRKWPRTTVYQPTFLNVIAAGVAPNSELNSLNICLNGDDDDGDGTPDHADDHIPGGDDDIVAVTLDHPRKMNVSLSYDRNIIRLYENPTKKLLDRQGLGRRFNAEVGATMANSTYKGYDDHVVYVEGLSPGTTVLTLTGKGGFSDRVRINVRKVTDKL